ncbi:hypothetical protein B0H10DRAFT_1789987, partial [Mycena sp. CBHHK59/15]
VLAGHPGNKRTVFFLANEYLRAMLLAGQADRGKLGDVYEPLVEVVKRHIDVAAGSLDVEGLARA